MLRTSGQVFDAYEGVGGLHTLSARSAGSAACLLKVSLVQHNIHLQPHTILVNITEIVIEGCFYIIKSKLVTPLAGPYLKGHKLNNFGGRCLNNVILI